MGDSSIERELIGRALTDVRALVNSGDFVSLDRDELLPLLRDLEAIKRLLAVVDSRVLHVVDEIGLNLVHGASSTQALVRQELQVSPADALARTRAARDLAPRMDEDGAPLEPLLPRTAEALAGAAIGVEHAAVIRRFMQSLSPGLDPAVKAEAEATLAEQARTVDPQQLRAEAKQLQAKIDPASVKADDDAAHANRAFRMWSSRRGTLKFEGELPADAGEMLQAAVSPLAAPKPTKDGVKDQRTPAQRNADGLVEVLSRYPEDRRGTEERWQQGHDLPDDAVGRPPRGQRHRARQLRRKTQRKHRPQDCLRRTNHPCGVEFEGCPARRRTK